MLTNYIKNAIEDLNSLIELTKEDIADIKQAKNGALFTRIKAKEDIITSFEQKKSLIDNEILKEHEKNPELSLNELLPEATVFLLDQFKEKLFELKELNKNYARQVLSVGEFYNSLLEELIPTEMDGYNKVASSASSLKVVV
jgi:predicted DNA-binding protein YlxM (UPF0122 family)